MDSCENETIKWCSAFRRSGIRHTYSFISQKDRLLELTNAIVGLTKVYSYNSISIASDSTIESKSLSLNIVINLRKIGFTAFFLDCKSSPEIAYISSSSDSLFILISGSHESPYYTGLKFFFNGTQLSDNDLWPLKSILLTKEKKLAVVDSYAEQIIHKVFELIGNIDKKKIIVFNSNSPGGRIVSEILIGLGHEVIHVDHINTSYPNDPWLLFYASCWNERFIDSLLIKVNEFNAILGILIDEDGDRVLLFNENFGPITSDEMGAIISIYNESRKVISDFRCSPSVEVFLEKHNKDLILTEVGRRNVIDAMLESGAYIGFEISGHFFIQDHNYIHINSPFVAALAASSPDFFDQLEELRLGCNLKSKLGEYRVEMNLIDIDRFREKLSIINSFRRNKEFTFFPTGWIYNIDNELYIVIRRCEGGKTISLSIRAKDLYKHHQILELAKLNNKNSNY